MTEKNTYVIDVHSGTWFEIDTLLTAELTDDEVWSLDTMSDSERVAFFQFKAAEQAYNGA